MMIDDFAISFIIPAYNCADTIEESINSIVDGNMSADDEIVVVNDGSTDRTPDVLLGVQKQWRNLKVVNHRTNRGGSAARNTAIDHAANDLIFCLDSDNLLAPGSVRVLRETMLASDAQIVSPHQLRYFTHKAEEITHTWEFLHRPITLADALSGPIFPGASGNYLFTRHSWERAGRYPEFAGALDTWGLGIRQIANGFKMVVAPDTFYFHRYGHESYWTRDSRGRRLSLTALQILIPFLDRIHPDDVEYIMGPEGRNTWFESLAIRPLRVINESQGQTGEAIPSQGAVASTPKKGGQSIIEKLMRLLRR